jgi:hypothetical protein
VEVVTLRRNVGHQRAIAVGLSLIFETKDVEAIGVMDCDGEDRPEDLFRLLEKHEDLQQPEIIFAERARRSETPFFRVLYQAYCGLHLCLTGHRIRFGNFSVIPRKLLGRLVVDPNLWLHFAATVVSGRVPYSMIPTSRGRRLHGKSKLNFIDLVIHGLAAISCYNETVGVRLLFSSLGIGAILFVLILTVLAVRFSTSWAVAGWATYTVGLLLLMLVQVFLIVVAFVAVAIGSRKANFFLPVQQYRFLIDEISRII